MDSMEQPATAPPMVMVLSSGTTIGTRPRGQRPIHELAEGDARLGDADAPLGVDLDDLVEVEQVDLLVGVLLVVNLGDLVGDDPLLPGERRRALPPAKLLRDPRHLLGMSRAKHRAFRSVGLNLSVHRAPSYDRGLFEGRFDSKRRTLCAKTSIRETMFGG